MREMRREGGKQGRRRKGGRKKRGNESEREGGREGREGEGVVQQYICTEQIVSFRVVILLTKKPSF